jgi:hypothetical protein
MKTITVLIISTLFLTACGPTNIEQPSSVDTNAVVNSIVADLIKKAAKDTGFNRRQENNKFKNDSSNYTIDKKTTKRLKGLWKLDGDADMVFLKTKFHPTDKVEFSDSPTVIPTSWGELHYKRLAKFYMTESASHGYEYCVTTDNELILIDFDYYNDDLSFKDKPDLITVKYSITFVDSNTVIVYNDFQKFKLIKI